MTYDNMLHIIDSWGLNLKTEHYWQFKQYFLTMLRRRRCMILTNNEKVIAILFFFITNDYTRLYKKGEFECPHDHEWGFQMYVDKLLCKHWTPYIRRLVQNTIEEKFPHVEVAYYHRAPNDRCVRILKRRSLCTR